MRIIKKLEAWMKNFIWIGNLEKKKVVILAWKTYCKRKNEGGIGLRSLKTFNEAFNMHICWNLFQGTKI